MKCPKCGSEHVQFSTNTHSTGFSLFDSCCGFIVMGPLGLLCGTCGMGSDTEEFWICHDCGHKFSTERAKEKEKEEAKLESEYRGNLSMLAEAGEKSHEEIQEDLTNAENKRQAVYEKYQKCLERCINSEDLEVKKQANILKRDHTILAWTVLIISGIATLFTLDGTSFIPFFLSATLCLTSIVYLIIYNKKSKKAKEVLNEIYPEFYSLSMELNEAEAQEKKAKDLAELYKKVKKYEQNHPKK